MSSTQSQQINIISLNGGYFQRQKTIKYLTTVFNGEVIKFDDSYSGEYIINELSSLDNGMFSEQNNKIFIINNLPELQKGVNTNKKYSQVFEECSKNSEVLIILNNCSNSVLDKFIKKIGKVIDCDESVNTSGAYEYSLEFFKENKKKINEEDIGLILDRIGIVKDKVNLDQLHSSLMLILNFNKEKSISKENILLSIHKNYNFDIFDFFNILDSKNYCEIYYNYKCGLKCNNNDVNKFLCSSLPLLRWRYKMIYLYNLFKSENKNIIQEFNKLKKINKEGVEVNLYSDYNIKNLNNKYTLEESQDIINYINFLLKSTRENLSQEELDILVQIFFIKVCKLSEFEDVIIKYNARK